MVEEEKLCSQSSIALNMTNIAFYIQFVIFNRHISRCLKNCKVAPLYEKDDPQSPCNYHPISLLSIFGNILKMN